ncbi:FAD-binding and (Fe-S)-binding domain-containing protein [Streptomyces bohaiensis]|uniref:FAD-binding and (Fe-S)-binding domain-containing protein n=1 Tax=Streptomyces bohaiensis TaxID=1431344 RepID=UPI003B7FA0C9
MPLLDPDPAALRPAAGTPAADRVPPELAEGTPQPLRRDLTDLLGAEQVLWRVTDLVSYASDASPYRFVPRVVVIARHTADVAAVLGYARRHGRDVVFRAGGTSLNGQAQGEDILVDVRRHWAGATPSADGTRLRVLPGTTVQRANAALARHGRVLGPDPASAIAATLGGVVANNASGMTAGTTRNSYRTATSMTIVLPSGTVVDTAAPDADTALAAAEPDLAAGLLALRQEILADAALTDRIRAKHQLKNTNGYRLDAFLDSDSPAAILRGLMVGSQGTLGFLAEIVMDTLPLHRHVLAGLLFFPSLAAAAAAVPHFTAAGAPAVELMDGNTLRASVAVDGVPADWAELPTGTTALLVEFRAPDEAAAEAARTTAEQLLGDLELIAPVASVTNAFTADPAVIAGYWKARKAFVTAVGGARPPGTTLITEDFAVPPERLSEACEALLELQERHGFDAAVAGHAAHGNLHFLLAFDAADPADVDRYAAFMAEFCELTVERFDGSLKAEHATGRNIAPFLELEWGERATALMWRIKRLIDPTGVLAPRVMLDRDPRAHLRGLKSIPAVEAEADPCIECGFCEPVCPSRDLTTTPRQRIVLRREMMRQPAGSEVGENLLADYGYAAVDTCAGDSSCRVACPVGIDTGAMMKEFRSRRHSDRQERAATAAARRFAVLERAARLAVTAAATAGDTVSGKATALARRAVSHELVPQWLPGMPPAAGPLPRTPREGATAVYYPACVNRIFGEPEGLTGSLPLPRAVVALALRADRPVWVPEDVAGTCCATIWHSKGYEGGNTLMANRVVEAAWRWTDHGRLPLVVDASSCTLGLAEEVVPYLTEANRERHARLTVLDSLQWAVDQLLPRLAVNHPVASAVVHPTCSMQHLGDEEALRRVAEACAGEAVVPLDATCCGFAGDRGMLHEELTASATAREAAEVTARPFDAHLSANRMCEIGMEQATGRPYHSALIALERATRPAGPAAPGAEPEPS